MIGSGLISIGEGELKMFGATTYSVTNKAGWGNVEVTAYAKMVNLSSDKEEEGFMAAQNDANLAHLDGCNAFGYIARIDYSTGNCVVQKEYFFSNPGSVVSPSIAGNCLPGATDFPLGTWIGMRLTVQTISATEVRLKLEIDEGATGTFTTGVDHIDVAGEWLANKEVPQQCTHVSGDIVSRAGQNCFIRANGESSVNEVHWRDMVESLPSALVPPPIVSPAPEPATPAPTSSLPVPPPVPSPEKGSRGG